MLTTNDLGKRRPYTLKEIVELDYPEFWGGAKEGIRVVKELQNMMLGMLPISRRHLPSTFDQLKAHKQAQIALLNYLKMRSIYGLAYAIWELLDTNCRKLAQARLEVEQDQIEDAMGRLVDVMSLVDSITKSFDFVKDQENGFYMLKDMIDTRCPGMDFFVKRGTANSTWSYRDIVGTIQGLGFSDENICNSLLFDDDPKEPNIGGLMERPEDDKMVVVY